MRTAPCPIHLQDSHPIGMFRRPAQMAMDGGSRRARDEEEPAAEGFAYKVLMRFLESRMDEDDFATTKAMLKDAMAEREGTGRDEGLAGRPGEVPGEKLLRQATDAKRRIMAGDARMRADAAESLSKMFPQINRIRQS